MNDGSYISARWLIFCLACVIAATVTGIAVWFWSPSGSANINSPGASISAQASSTNLRNSIECSNNAITKPSNSGSPPCYSINLQCVFYNKVQLGEARNVEQSVVNADAKTFTALTTTRAGSSESCYGKDRSGVFLNQNKIAGANAITFSVVESPPDFDFSKDANHVYFMGYVIAGAQPASFEVLSPDQSSEGGIYSRDDIHVYFTTEDSPPWGATWVIKGADPDTFEYIGEAQNGSLYAKDKNDVYYFTQIVRGANPVTFEVASTSDSSHQGDAWDQQETFLYGIVVQ